MELFKCGIIIKPKIGAFIAMITAISIRFDKVAYEVSYFYNGEYKTCYLHEDEFTVENVDRVEIGFKK